MKKGWKIVFIAGLFEIGWVIGLKHADNTFSWVCTLIAIYGSMHLLIIASKYLPVGTAYAVFTGMGTAGTVLFDLTVFGEPFRLEKAVLIVLLAAGVIGLKMVTPDSSVEKENI